ncbi:hypothetical protein ACF8O8_01800 [Pseudomonas sp. TYF_14]|uniref:hypothetical protein n=1 Tax=Pseudomonas sp. TYF_14 TaxID=3367193 RepID=UPI00370A0A49
MLIIRAAGQVWNYQEKVKIVSLRALGGGFSVYLKSSAARAAHREQARSYICFGPIMPVGFARERPGAWLDIASYKQGGRARVAQDGLARNKCRSELARDAPRGRRSIS